VRQIKLAIRQLLGARKYSVSYRIVSYAKHQYKFLSVSLHEKMNVHIPFSVPVKNKQWRYIHGPPYCSSVEFSSCGVNEPLFWQQLHGHTAMRQAPRTSVNPPVSLPIVCA